MCARSTNPNLSWSAAKCNGKGGYNSLNVDFTGCYTMTSSFWSDFAGLAMSQANFCDNFGIAITQLTVGDGNLGFEEGDLTGWSVPPSNTQGAVSVACSNQYGPAAEGSCYAVVSGQSKRHPAVNALYRDVSITNPGGCKNSMQQLSFQYKFKASDDLPFNDYVKVIVKDKATNQVILSAVTDIAAVGNYGSSTWISKSVNIGSLSAGQKVVVELRMESTNAGDSSVASFGLLDDVKVLIVP